MLPEQQKRTIIPVSYTHLDVYKRQLLHSPEGYFIADIQLTDDRKGVMIQNIQSITPGKAQELIKAMTPKLEAHAANIEAAKEQKHEDVYKRQPVWYSPSSIF